MAEWTEEVTHVAGTDLAIIKGGQGKPLLVLHEELGHPGWLNWHAALAKERTLIIPIQPGIRQIAARRHIRNVHRVGALFYAWVLRDLDLAPIDVIGSPLADGPRPRWRRPTANNSARWCWWRPLGIKPPEGEIMDIFSVTHRAPLNVPASTIRGDARSSPNSTAASERPSNSRPSRTRAPKPPAWPGNQS